MKGLIGKKLGMTNIFDEDRKSIACTLIEVEPCVITQLKNKEGKDGYDAVQIASGFKKAKNTSKAELTHFKKANCEPKRYVREMKAPKVGDYTLGQLISVEQVFAEGDKVAVVGSTKGRGFQGVVKRHGFAGVGGQTHGQHNRLRAPGSMGACSFPSRVFKGKKLPGQYGNEQVKIKNLKVLKIIADQNLLVVSGCVPGANGSLLIVEK